MAELITIARPYAEAAFKLAQETGQLVAWSSQLESLSEFVANPEVASLLGNPAVERQQLVALLNAAIGKTALPEVERFVAVLLENHRVQALADIAALFEHLKHQAEGVVDAVIETAFPLTDAQLTELLAGLEKRFQNKVQATVTVNPALLGGVRVVVGDDVIDASVQGKLQSMAYRLKS